MSHATAVDTPSPPGRSAARAAAPRRRGLNERKKARTGLLFVAPFALVFVAFLILPLVYAFYLSLYSKGLATGVVFAGLKNYAMAFSDPSFLKGIWFVVRFALVLIPVQMLVSLALALVLDSLTTRLARFARLMIFLPYAIPAVIGALMWGFLYSPTFGPMQQLAGLFGADAPFLLGPDLVFFGLMNVVTWQWAGYYMIIIYAALQGIDSSIYEAARIDGANAWQIALRIKVPMVSSALVLILVFALIGTLQFFTEPQILRPLSNGTITPDFTPNIYAFSQAFAYANFNYASAISFALGHRRLHRGVCVPLLHSQARERLHMTTTSIDAPAGLRAAAGNETGGRGPRTAASSCPTCSSACWSSTSSSRSGGCSWPAPRRGRAVQRQQRGALVRRDVRAVRRTSTSCSPTTTASTCAGSATRSSTPSPAASAPPCWRCWPATASPSTASAAAG